MTASNTLGAIALASLVFAVFTAMELLSRPVSSPKGIALEGFVLNSLLDGEKNADQIVR